MGVMSSTDVLSDLCFGPIPTALMIADPAYLIGNMTSDTFPEIPLTTVNLTVTVEAQRFIDWVPYLRSARCHEEQNLELLRHSNGDIFYRITKPVPAGQELLIWFSKEYCRDISMPTAEDVAIDKESNSFKCEDCGASFKFVHPLICHQTFKCKGNPRSLFLRPKSDPPAEEREKCAKRKLDLGAGEGEGSAFRKVTRLSPSGLSNNNNNNNNNSAGGFLDEVKFGIPDPRLGFPLLHSLPFCSPPGPPAHLPPPVVSSPFPLVPFSPPAIAASPTSSGPALRGSSFPFPRSSNPMVETLLHSAITGENLAVSPLSPNPLSTLNLAQNWCAKCNATFRMTSDLVYHMRTHHHRDTDVAANNPTRRADKLRCEVCGETFRERHHLTRHMTSHE